MNTFTEDNRKHLDYLQSIITRMNSNSFLIKGWTVTLVSAILALAASTKEWLYLAISFLPVIMFWILDSFYLQQERKFRCLYEQAIKNPTTIIVYDLNINLSVIKINKRNRFISVVFSKTMSFYHLLLGFLVFICFLFSFSLKRETIGKTVTPIIVTDTVKIKIYNK